MPKSQTLDLLRELTLELNTKDRVLEEKVAQLERVIEQCYIQGGEKVRKCIKRGLIDKGLIQIELGE